MQNTTPLAPIWMVSAGPNAICARPQATAVHAMIFESWREP